MQDAEFAQMGYMAKTITVHLNLEELNDSIEKQ